MLQKQMVGLQLGQGIDTKTDEKLATFVNLENAIFEKGGTLTKRPGYTKTSNATTFVTGPGNPVLLSQINALSAFNDQILGYTGTEFYSLSETSGLWSRKGFINNTQVSSQFIQNDGDNYSNPSVATINNISLWSFSNSQDFIYYSVVDEETGAFIVSKKSFSTAARQAKVVALSNFFCVFYYATIAEEIRMRVFGAANPDVQIADILITDDAYNLAGLRYDACSTGEVAIVVFKDETAANDECSVITVDKNFNVSAPSIIPEPNITGQVSCDGSEDGNGLIALERTDTIISVWRLNPLGSLSKIGDAGNDAGDLALTVKGKMSIGAASGRFCLVREQGSGGELTQIQGYIRNYFNAAILLFAPISHFRLESRPFFFNNQAYYLMSHQSDTQQSYFLRWATRQGHVARLRYRTAGATYTTPINISEIRPGTYIIPTLQKTQVFSIDGTLFTNQSIFSTKVEFDNQVRFQNGQLGELHIAGGSPQMYDGSRLVEQGFDLYPEISASVNISASGSMAAGTYLFTATYEWTDNLGQTHISAPAIPLSVTLTGSQNAVNLFATRAQLSVKPNVSLCGYSTEAGGSVFYKFTNDLSPVGGNSFLGQKTNNLVRLQTDNNLVGNQTLYTLGGVLENIPVPPYKLIATHQNRLFYSGLENPNQIVYTKEKLVGVPAEYSEFLTINVDEKGGPITGLANLDQYLAIFKQRQIFVLAGSGPAANGLQNSYNNPQLITTDVGCNNPNSIVATPEGVMFQSPKGIYVLDRSLSVSYVGAPVERWNNEYIEAAALLSWKNEVRFITKNRTLVYNYFFKQWSQFTTFGEDNQAVETSYFFLKNGEIFKEDGSVWTDEGIPITMKMETGWLALNGIQNYKRVYSLSFLGQYFSPHNLQVRVATDYNPSWLQDSIIPFGNGTAYGDESPYGSGSFGDGTIKYQAECHFKHQKTQAIKVQIADYPTEPAGQSFSLTHLNFEVGAKKKNQNSRESGMS